MDGAGISEEAGMPIRGVPAFLVYEPQYKEVSGEVGWPHQKWQ